MGLSFLGGLLLFGLLSSGCQNFRSQKSHQEGRALPLPPKGFKPSPIRLLIDLENSEQAQFSPDGERLLFMSRQLSQHHQAQVYEYNIAQKRKRRITFQDGEILYPNYHPSKDLILYASTTDEIKENPKYIQRALQRLQNSEEEVKEPSASLPWEDQPFEIYSSLRNGEEIRRWTRSPGYDGEPRFHPLQDKIVFSSLRSGSLQIYRQVGPQGRPQLVWGAPELHQTEPRFSPSDESLIWVQLSQDLKTSQIVRQSSPQQDPEPLTSGSFIHRQPEFSPDGEKLIFSSNRGDGETFQIYTLNIETGCLKRLTYTNSNQFYPRWSPDQKQVVFHSDESGKNRIYMMEYRAPEDCEESDES